MNKNQSPTFATAQSVYPCKNAFPKALILQQNKHTYTHTSSNTLDLQNPTQGSDLKIYQFGQVFFHWAFSVAHFSSFFTELASSIWVP